MYSHEPGSNQNTKKSDSQRNQKTPLKSSTTSILIKNLYIKQTLSDCGESYKWQSCQVSSIAITI